MKFGRNEACWCGSGRKFKRCHFGREHAARLSRQDLMNQFRSLRSRPRCYHPDAPVENCGRSAIASHTVPASLLNHIARDGHVYAFPTTLGAIVHSGGSLRPRLLGINKASTVRIFCPKHDSTLFSQIEAGELRACETHAFFLLFRALAYELYAKEAGVMDDGNRRELDRGRPLPTQIAMQESFAGMQVGFRAALQDLQRSKGTLDQMWRSHDFSKMEFGVIWMRNVPDVMCCASATPDHDFLGRPLQDLGDLGDRMQILSFSLLGLRDRGCAFFAWTDDNSTVARQFLDSLIGCGPIEIPNALIRYVFGDSENAYMRPEWWEGLDRPTQERLVARVMDAVNPFTPIRPDQLVDDGLRVVTWEVIGFDSNVAQLRAAWESRT